MPISRASNNGKTLGNGRPSLWYYSNTVLLYLDIVEPNSVDNKSPVLKIFSFKHLDVRNDEDIKRSQVLSYRIFEHVKFHEVIKTSFQSIHVEQQNAARHLVSFFPIGQVQLTSVLQKEFWLFLNFSLKKQPAKMKINSMSRSMADFIWKSSIFIQIFGSMKKLFQKFHSMSSKLNLLETDCNISIDLRSAQLFIRGRNIKGAQTRLANAEEIFGKQCSSLAFLYWRRPSKQRSPQLRLKFSSRLNFQEQKERRKAYLNVK